MIFEPGLYRASNAGVEQCRIDFVAADAYPPNIFLEAMGGHIEDGKVFNTRLVEGMLEKMISSYRTDTWMVWWIGGSTLSGGGDNWVLKPPPRNKE